MSAVILSGDCRGSLSKRPAESVHCVCTSPPYYRLRSYNTEPQVLGGDPEHVHEWGEAVDGKRARGSDLGNISPKQGSNSGSLRMVDSVPTHRFCPCGAWLGELGQEPTLSLYVAHLVEFMAAVHRVLHPSGVVFLNIGDSYYSDPGKGGSGTPTGRNGRGEGYDRRASSGSPEWLKPKDQMLVPQRVAIALQEWGWWVRAEVIWSKPNAMCEPVKDRPSRSHEQVWVLTKSHRYYWDQEAGREPFADKRQGRDGGKQASERNRGGREDGFTKPNGIDPSANGGRNCQSVWRISPEPFSAGKLGITEADHFAAMPQELIRRCVALGSSEHGVCPACLSPWERIIERGDPLAEKQRACGGDARGEYHGADRKEYAEAGVQTPAGVKARALASMFERNTTGWKPTCSCPPSPPIPATVLDPFGGTGRVGRVAVGMGRDAVICELKSCYLDIIRANIGLFAE